jgi:hypothetical protein
MYLAKIRKPILEDFGISREMLKNAGLPAAEADEIADRTEQSAEDARNGEKGRTYSLATHSSPSRGRLVSL